MWSFCAFGAECMLYYVGHSTPGEQSWGQMVGDNKAYGQFTGNVTLIDELKLKKQCCTVRIFCIVGCQMYA